MSELITCPESPKDFNNLKRKIFKKKVLILFHFNSTNKEQLKGCENYLLTLLKCCC